MKILVTSGGTVKLLIGSRSITAFILQGRLGKIITGDLALLAAGHEVCLITTRQALKPEAHPNLSIPRIDNTSRPATGQNARTC